MIRASARPEIKCKVFEGQISIAPTSGLSYASANAFRNAVDSFTAKHCDTRIVVFDLSRLTVLDYTATSILHVRLWFVLLHALTQFQHSLNSGYIKSAGGKKNENHHHRNQTRIQSSSRGKVMPKTYADKL